MTRWISAVAIGMVGLMCSTASAEISLSIGSKNIDSRELSQQTELDGIFKNTDAKFTSLEFQACDVYLRVLPQAGAKGSVSIVGACSSSEFTGSVDWNHNLSSGIYNIACTPTAAPGKRYGTAAGLNPSGVIFRLKLNIAPGASGVFKIGFDAGSENILGLSASPPSSMLPSPVFQGGTLTVNQVPEPSTWAMLTSGLAVGGLGLWRRRRSK